MNNENEKIEDKLNETVAFLKRKFSVEPKLGFVLGSGLSGFASQVKKTPLTKDGELAFQDIPHFTASTVEGHPGRLVVGQVEGVPVAVLQGRLHAYEGLSFQQVVFPMRALAKWGVKTVVVTNAAGGLKSTMKPGDFMVIRDQINLTGDNPLRGPNLSMGPRFVDMTEHFDKKLTTILKECLRKEKARVHEGVYVGVLGPTYETAAEIRFFAKMGGGAVGMSTVAEVIAARHAGVRVVGLSCVTNLGTGLSKIKLNHEDVKDMAKHMEGRFVRALTHFTKKVKSQL